MKDKETLKNEYFMLKNGLAFMTPKQIYTLLGINKNRYYYLKRTHQLIRTIEKTCEWYAIIIGSLNDRI